MNIRTDLAIESLEIGQEILPEGVSKNQQQKGEVVVTTVEISNEQGATILGKPIGKYITLEVPDFKGLPENFEQEVKVISDEIKNMMPKKEGLVLVVGLGNSDITPDALGPFAINSIFATRHISGEIAKSTGLEGLRGVCAIAPSVLGKTGMETAEIIKAICDKINPNVVVVVDALASKSIDRLGKTIQISNVGISPGSGVQNKRKELSKETLGVEVISIGVPMVVDMTTIAYELLGEGFQSEKVSTRGQTMMVTPREIDVIISQAAKTVAMAINLALQPMLEIQDIMSLVS